MGMSLCTLGEGGGGLRQMPAWFWRYIRSFCFSNFFCGCSRSLFCKNNSHTVHLRLHQQPRHIYQEDTRKMRPSRKCREDLPV